jgi:hypothetical protein
MNSKNQHERDQKRRAVACNAWFCGIVMSDWLFLNKHRVRAASATIPPQYVSDDSYGFNGLFRLPKDGEIVRCIASDGTDCEDERFKWQHVSVSVEMDKRPPRWGLMCWVKDLFWEPEDWVCQFHPAKSEYVNYHPACLHLWRPLKEKLPTPLAIMVGPRQSLTLRVPQNDQGHRPEK